MNLETITDTQSLRKIQSLNGFSRTRAKRKLLRRRKRSSRKFLDPSEKTKVIKTDNSLEFGISCEDLSWNHRTSTPHRSETNGTAERAVRSIKEGTSAVLLQSGLDENGGLILWSAIAICEMSKTTWQMEKHLMNSDLEYHLKARSFRCWKIWRRQRSTVEGSMQKEMLTPKRETTFIFPIADGTARLFGRDYEVRESTLQGWNNLQ